MTHMRLRFRGLDYFQHDALLGAPLSKQEEETREGLWVPGGKTDKVLKPLGLPIHEMRVSARWFAWPLSGFFKSVIPKRNFIYIQVHQFSLGFALER